MEEDHATSRRAAIQHLEADRLIRIVVGSGDATKTFTIQQALLEAVSPYFVKALRNEHLGAETKTGVLRFPEGRIDVWECLCYWMLRRELPDGLFCGDIILIMRCWVLGDKYAIVDFQDEDMMILLYESQHNGLGWDVIKEGVIHSRPGSPIRRLLAYEAVIQVYEDGVDAEALIDVDGAGFMSEFVTAHQAFEKNNQHQLWFDEAEQWRDFMAGKSVEKHWLFEEGEAEIKWTN